MNLYHEAARLYTQLLAEELGIEMGTRPGTWTRHRRVEQLRQRALERYRRRRDTTELTPSTRREPQNQGMKVST